MDKAYWTNKYATDPGDTDPSLFARSCMATVGHRDRTVHAGDSLLELGHGNGRDALYFAKLGVNVFGCDQSGMICEGSGDIVDLQQGDFTELDLEQIRSRFGQDSFDHVYSRFSWHSITELGEYKTLDWIRQVLSPYGSLLIECRTVYDELFQVGFPKGTWTYQSADGHCRRFIQPGRLINHLLEDGFQIDYAEVGRGFAPYKNEDPKVLRVHAVFEGP